MVYESAFCAMLDKNVPTGVPIYELSSLLFFLVPMMIIIILYVLIGLQIRQSSRHSLGKQMQGAVHGETKQIQSKKSIVRMLGNNNSGIAFETLHCLLRNTFTIL